MSGARRDYDKKDLYTHFLEHGIYFQPGHKSLDARIYRLNTYFESQRLKIHDCCPHLIDELSEYKFPERTLNNKLVNYNKPVDKNNHCINPLEWITMALPNNPNKLRYGSYDRYGNDIASPKEQQKQFAVHALSDPPPTHQQPNYSVFSIGGMEW